ncbi:MAG: type I pullulanase [Candidatus Neomarinimicrobiota bacterium]
MKKTVFLLTALFLVLPGVSFFNPMTQGADMKTLTVHYHRYDGQYQDWSLWTWVDQTSREVLPEKKDDFGLVFKLSIEKYPPSGNIGLLPKYKKWERKDDPNRLWSRSMPAEIWILESLETIFSQPPDTKPSIHRAFLDSPHKVTLVFTNPIRSAQTTVLRPVFLLRNDVEIKGEKCLLVPYGSDSSKIVEVTIPQTLSIDSLPGEARVDGFKPIGIFLRGILDQPEYVTSEPLGAFYFKQSTKFSVYAPAATEITLNLYDLPKGGEARPIKLSKGKNGVWKTEVSGDLIGKYYTYSVTGLSQDYNPKQEIVDPYARCVTTHDGRSLIFEDNTPIVKSPSFPFQDAVIYEMHVRDFSIGENSGMTNKGKYLAFTETGTKLPGTDLSTGIDHLVELGVNTVQLLPIQDFEHDNQVNNYFWGYMTVNFNSPDGWFTTNQNDASRIREVKQMVSALHEHGIKVILDVVYNHTAESNPLVHYNFNGFAPNYFYRQRLDGSYWNGSGCGNEVRSENPMARRFIVESLKYWVETYDIDGYRFDLLGLIDMKTVREIVKSLREIKPDIFIYGEPWTAGATPIDPTVKGTQRGEGFAVFNDNFRDALKGPWNNTDPGYIQTGINVAAVKRGIMGSIDDFANSPLEVINYVACHDGRTLWDQLVASTESGTQRTDTELKAMDKLASVILFTSQGVPFILGGQEFLRTKFGSHNSYNQPDKINKIRWDYKQENLDIFRFYKGMIQLRKEHPMFRMTGANEIRKNLVFFETLGLKVPQNCIGYRLSRGNSGDAWKEVLVLVNPNPKAETFQIPKGKWILVVDHSNAGTEIIAPISGITVPVKPISAMVMYRL